ncbi:hypothetical protein NCAS_0A14960 [Naumovozyma castellii]|uniref:Protein yippee-like n=1 Tax=Naumovozyma castellii TaxID=27288 RepID=G0V9A3_NAUCA|nr:hypothetical protein NCAS_0A14960 [Naumovozyma castellii CBS 4309]CCC68054.1 hypothetical protein NCAS_0A14960 [Naumovozyma castellii CBS 4309]
MGLHYPSYIEQSITSNKVITPEVYFNDPGETYRERRRPNSDKDHKGYITYGCRLCRTHLSSSTQIISRDYKGKLGNAYLMENLLNIVEGKQQEKVMVTGKYTICEIHCHLCKKVIGWKYLKSNASSQKFKVGKYIMEMNTVRRCA